MSKKRTSTDSSKDEETTEGLDAVPVVQQEDNTKRANLTSFSDTKLEDLPMELIGLILVKVVAMEVKDTKLAKSVWKEKVDVVINRSRLRTVCSQWNNILTTNFFRNEVNRTLDSIPQAVMRLEMLHQSSVPPDIYRAATMKDELFMMRSTARDYHTIYFIEVYDRNDMAKVKDVIQLGRIGPEKMLACSVSNCLYVVCLEQAPCLSVIRIGKDDMQKFNISPCISGIPCSVCSNNVSVSVNGSLITIANNSSRSGWHPSVVSVYRADGTLQHKFSVSRFAHGFRYVDGATQKSNGNIVLVCVLDFDQVGTKLLEMEMTGGIVRQYQSSFSWYTGVIFTDIYGRIVLTDMNNKYELLDSEFNLMEFTGLTLKKDQCILSSNLNYNSETGESVTIIHEDRFMVAILTIFRFTEE